MRINKTDLLQRIVDAVKECGWNVAYIDIPPSHPFRLSIYSADETINVLVYIWTITHGGAHRLPQEYRIQITGIPNGIVFEPGFKTLILGYWPGGDVFAGFDAKHHHGFINYSPSLQIREEALREAHCHGLAVYNKGNGELALAFRPDHFIEYCRNINDYHSLGENQRDTQALEIIAQDEIEINNAAVNMAEIDKRNILRKIAAGHIIAGFRHRVLAAYEYRCAMCGIQLDLIEAAHIVPAGYPVTSYKTSNGVALCALHHLAFDKSLVAFNSHYQIIVNDERLNILNQLNRGGGEYEFINGLRSLIYLPAAITDRPNSSLIEQGLSIRGWPKNLR